MWLTKRSEGLVLGQADRDQVGAIHALEGDQLVTRVDHRAGNGDAQALCMTFRPGDDGAGNRRSQAGSLRRGQPGHRRFRSPSLTITVASVSTISITAAAISIGRVAAKRSWP